MTFEDAQSRLFELATMNVFYADELGADFFTNDAILTAALASFGGSADLDALMAGVESSITVYDPEIEFGEYDNTGATVTFDDGTVLSYDDYLESGLADSDVGVAPIDVDSPFEWLDATAQKKTIGISEMSHMGSDV